jgi:N-acetylglutamate synthase-like GNAT family acetyltransferase
LGKARLLWHFRAQLATKDRKLGPRSNIQIGAVKLESLNHARVHCLRLSDFLDMQYEAQQRFHENEYKKPVDQIVVRGNKAVGRVTFEPREHEIRCVEVAILPQHRNAGIGTRLIRELQTEAKRQKKPLRLQVIRFSRAVTLFERLGFQRISETGTHFQMEWTPGD